MVSQQNFGKKPIIRSKTNVRTGLIRKMARILKTTIPLGNNLAPCGRFTKEVWQFRTFETRARALRWIRQKSRVEDMLWMVKNFPAQIINQSERAHWLRIFPRELSTNRIAFSTLQLGTFLAVHAPYCKQRVQEKRGWQRVAHNIKFKQILIIINIYIYANQEEPNGKCILDERKYTLSKYAFAQNYLSNFGMWDRKSMCLTCMDVVN